MGIDGKRESPLEADAPPLRIAERGKEAEASGRLRYGTQPAGTGPTRIRFSEPDAPLSEPPVNV